MQFNESAELKRAFIEHLDALRAYSKPVNRYGQRLTETERVYMDRRLQGFIKIGGAYGLSEGALRGLIRPPITCG